MPKVIPELEEKILTAAKELFSKNRYRDIEMKQIAKEAGIAVGTLYNYFPNKKGLFYKIFEESWQSTYIKLKEVVNSRLDPLQKINLYMSIAYDEIEKKGRLGIEIVQSSQITPDKPTEFFAKNEIILMLCQCIQDTREKYGLKLEQEMDERFAETAILMIVDGILVHPLEREKNIHFIIKTIQCIIC